MTRRLISIVVATAWLAACATPAASTSSAVPTASPLATATTAAPSESPVARTDPPEASATGESLREFPTSLCCRGRELDPGTYRIPRRTGVDASIEVPPGWRIIREDTASVLALVRGENALGDASEWLAFFVLDEDESAVQFQQAVLDMDDFDVVTQPADGSIAGFDAWRVDLQALPNPGFEGDPGSGVPPESQVVTAIQDYFTEGFAWTTASPEARVTILTLRIGERAVVIYMDVPADDADASIQGAMGILASLKAI